ncbi:MAG: hypothetical protein ACI845_000229 [Gammaproteobacteria bacterium]|jgi:hypothetical protein
MNLDRELIEEIEILKRYSMNNDASLDLSNSPDSGVAAAATRLSSKSIIDQEGKLTDDGRMALDHLNRLTNLLSTPLEPI